MPEIRPQSVKKHASSSRVPERRVRAKTRQSTAAPDARKERKRVYEQLAKIQLNTAGLSGPYRSEAETMQRVVGNHDAVRSLRIVMRRSLLVPSHGPVAAALLDTVMRLAQGSVQQAARWLGTSARHLRHLLASQDSPQPT